MVVDDLSMKNYQLFSIFVVFWAIPYSAPFSRQSVNTQIPERSPDINVWTPVGSTDASAKRCEVLRSAAKRSANLRFAYAISALPKGIQRLCSLPKGRVLLFPWRTS